MSWMEMSLDTDHRRIGDFQITTWKLKDFKAKRIPTGKKINGSPHAFDPYRKFPKLFLLQRAVPFRLTLLKHRHGTGWGRENLYETLNLGKTNGDFADDFGPIAKQSHVIQPLTYFVDAIVLLIRRSLRPLVASMRARRSFACLPDGFP